ncbi:MAG: FAD:protein FMN transferase, partial [Ruminococcaceae bacterium]|nr:FAD:protein FMN transferase [Oscillospiraceae bacterium]
MHTLPRRKQNKNDLHTIAALGLIVALLLFTVSGCAPKGPQRYKAEWTGSFDTLIQLIAYTDDEKTFNQFERQAEDRFRELHQLYDRYNSYEGINNIQTINERAGGEPVKVEQEIIDMLIIFRDYSLATNRVVDVTLGPVLEIWHDYRTRALADPAQAEVPPLSELQQ